MCIKLKNKSLYIHVKEGEEKKTKINCYFPPINERIVQPGCAENCGAIGKFFGHDFDAKSSTFIITICSFFFCPS